MPSIDLIPAAFLGLLIAFVLVSLRPSQPSAQVVVVVAPPTDNGAASGGLSLLILLFLIGAVFYVAQ